jgi:hypothetical protein
MRAVTIDVVGTETGKAPRKGPHRYLAPSKDASGSGRVTTKTLLQTCS